MTINGGQPHRVGDEGQRYEISVFDEDEGKRIVIGWADKVSDKTLRSLETRPSWTNAQSRDRQKESNNDR